MTINREHPTLWVTGDGREINIADEASVRRAAVYTTSDGAELAIALAGCLLLLQRDYQRVVEQLRDATETRERMSAGALEIVVHKRALEDECARRAMHIVSSHNEAFPGGCASDHARLDNADPVPQMTCLTQAIHNTRKALTDTQRELETARGELNDARKQLSVCIQQHDDARADAEALREALLGTDIDAARALAERTRGKSHLRARAEEAEQECGVLRAALNGMNAQKDHWKEAAERTIAVLSAERAQTPPRDGLVADLTKTLNYERALRRQAEEGRTLAEAQANKQSIALLDLNTLAVRVDALEKHTATAVMSLVDLVCASRPWVAAALEAGGMTIENETTLRALLKRIDAYAEPPGDGAWRNEVATRLREAGFEVKEKVAVERPRRHAFVPHPNRDMAGICSVCGGAPSDDAHERDLIGLRKEGRPMRIVERAGNGEVVSVEPIPLRRPAGAVVRPASLDDHMRLAGYGDDLPEQLRAMSVELELDGTDLGRFRGDALRAAAEDAESDAEFAEKERELREGLERRWDHRVEGVGVREDMRALMGGSADVRAHDVTKAGGAVLVYLDQLHALLVEAAPYVEKFSAWEGDVEGRERAIELLARIEAAKAGAA